jgi:hypothetical protein
MQENTGNAVMIISARVREPNSLHSGCTERVAHHRIGGLGRDTPTLSTLADPKPGVALKSLPVDIMKPTPNYRFTSLSFDSDQLDAFTQHKVAMTCRLRISIDSRYDRQVRQSDSRSSVEGNQIARSCCDFEQVTRS